MMITIPNSYPDILKEDAIKLIDELIKILFETGIDGDVIILHKAGKQLTSLFYDCKNSRFDLSEHIIELQFLEFAVKAMKRLNNIGVFKNDDVWFASFYLYNICWNFSEVNSAFASGLIIYGIEHLLISNIMHDPYVENLTKRNVNYLIKATLSITHNILKVAGNRLYFSANNVISGLLKIASKDDKLAVLSTMCLSYIACNDNIENTTEFDIFYNVKLVFYYIKVASESSGKYNGYNMHEFFEVLRHGSLSRIQREAIIKLDGFDVLTQHLKSSKEVKVKREILLTMINLIDDKYKSKIREIVKYYVANKSELVSSAAQSLSFALSVFEKRLEENCEELGGKNIFINFASRDLEVAERIYENLEGLSRLPLLSCEYDSEMLQKSFDEAALIIVCVSEAFKGAVQFRVGCEYSLLRNKIVFPVLVQSNYKPEGWIRDFIAQVSDVCYDFSSDLDEQWGAFLSGLKRQLDTIQTATAATHQHNQHEVEVSSLEEAVTIGNASVVVTSSESETSQWLAKHGLERLQSRVGDIDMRMLHYMKTVRAEAPDFYFRSLEKNLNLSFVEILQLSAALDQLE